MSGAGQGGGNDKGGTGVGGGRTCPICGKPAIDKFKPFCSARCADIDLNRWLKGGYVIPGRQSDSDEDDIDAPSKPAGPTKSDDTP